MLPALDRTYGLTTTGSAATAALTAAELRAHLRLNTTAEDALLDGFIAAATDYFQEVTGRQLRVQSYILSLPGFPSREIVLPRNPVTATAITVQYLDTDNVTQTLAGCRLARLRAPAVVLPPVNTVWPATLDHPEAVSVTFEAGSATPAARFLTVVRLLAAHLYERREPTISGTIIAEIPYSLKSFLRSCSLGV